jgi:hypothetical protein
MLRLHPFLGFLPLALLGCILFLAFCRWRCSLLASSLAFGYSKKIFPKSSNGFEQLSELNTLN